MTQTNSDARQWYRCVRTYTNGAVEYLFPCDEGAARVDAANLPNGVTKVELQQFDGEKWRTIEEVKR